MKKQLKLDSVLEDIPKNVILLTSWLQQQGISRSTLQHYKKLGFIKSLEQGALFRAGASISPFGALYALQTQSNLPVHLGAKSALMLSVHKQYALQRRLVKLPSGLDKTDMYTGLQEVVTIADIDPMTPVFVFIANQETRCPRWLQKHDWRPHTKYFQTNLLDPSFGLIDYSFEDFSVKISNPVRAVLECLNLTPKLYDYSEYPKLMSYLDDVDVEQAQILLENCNSAQVKRLFLALAEICGHAWVEELDFSKIDIGKGSYSFFRPGVLYSKYSITIPPKWLEYGKSG